MPIPGLGPQNPPPSPSLTDQSAARNPTPGVPATGAAPAPAAPTATGLATAVDSPSSDAASLNLDHLAKAIGLDSDEVLRRLSNGEGLGSKLSAAGETGYGSTVGGMIRGGIVIDEYA
jgi:hypothetical protein